MVLFLDSTLREGGLFKQFPRKTNLEIARLAVETGADIIELPLPYRTDESETEELISRVREVNPECTVILHCRAYEPDLEQMKKFDVDGGAAYLAASDSHRKHKLHGMTKEDTEQRLLETADILKGQNWNYSRATIEDASALYLEDREFLLHLVSQLEKRDVMVSVPDTRGILFPEQTQNFVQDLMKTGAKLAGHNHDDFSFANYNTALQAKGGFYEVHTTLMGIGDRNGIADVFPTAMLLETLGVSTRIRGDKAERVYREFSAFTGVDLSFKHPLSEAARSLSAGVHQTYPEGYFPESKLRQASIILRASSNLSSKIVDKILKDAGHELDTERARELANLLAKKALELGADLTSDQMAEVISRETGVELDPARISRYIGQDQVCILVKMKPQSSSMEVKDWAIRQGGYRANILYASPYDLVIFAPNSLDGKAFVDLLREKYRGEIENTETAITD